jgi:hypothetical protein
MKSDTWTAKHSAILEVAVKLLGQASVNDELFDDHYARRAVDDAVALASMVEERLEAKS